MHRRLAALALLAACTGDNADTGDTAATPATPASGPDLTGTAADTTSDLPTTAASTSSTTDNPTTDDPTTAVPTTDVPTTDSPTTDDPTGDPTTGDPGPVRAYDLDADGVPDTDLSLGPCPAAPTSTCLLVASDIVATTEVLVSPTLDQCDATYLGRDIVVLGEFAGTPIHEVSLGHCRFDGAEGPPALAVVDVDAAAVIARADAPLVQDYAWSDRVRDPEGRLRPFLAPSYGDGENPLGNWGYLCMFVPGDPGSPGCGPGFVAIPTPTGAGVFREAGGTVQDLDGDLWDDINLIYHRRIYTVSPKTLGVIADDEYDVAATSEPNSPKWFHSGRNYGTHRAVTGDDAHQRLVIVGGTPVGSFTDDLCNVSRFLAVLDQQPDSPASRALAWATYFSFSSTIFTTYSPQYVDDPMQDVARLADAVDGCIHRFSDSRTVMDSQQVLLINYFAMDAPVDLCLKEQYALYQPPTWTDEKADAWYTCFAKNKKSPGTWGMQVVDEKTGTGLTGSQTTYVWGWSSALGPADEVLYLVEYLPPKTLWDLSDVQPTALQVQALAGGLWQPRGVFPVAGRPKLDLVAPQGPRGAGSYTPYAELTLHAHPDGPGVELEDGTIVGWDPASMAYVVR